MGKGSAPSAPDPYESAQAQYQYGTAAANYNTALDRPNIVTPYGSQTWSVSESPNGGSSPGSAPSAPSGSTPAPYQPSPAYQGSPYYRIGGGLGGSGAPIGGGMPPMQTSGGTSGSLTNGAPQYTENIALSPEQQALFEQQEQLQGNQQGRELLTGNISSGLAQQASKSLGQPITGFQTGINQTPVQSNIDTSGVPGIAGSSDLSGFTNQARNAAYQQQTQYLDPQFQQQQEQLDAQLRNSGAHPGDPAYDNAMKLFTNQKQQAYESAFNNANSQGLAEQQALYGESANTNQQLFGQAAAEQSAANQAAGQQFGQNLEGAQFGNQSAITLRDLPLNEYNAFNGGSQIPAPSFGLGGSGGLGSGTGGAGQVASPDIMSAFNNQYNGQLAQYNSDTASTNADVGAGATIIAAYLI